MKKVLLVVVLVFGVLVQVAGHYYATPPTSQAEVPGPAQVVQAYYDWHLGYVQGEGPEGPRNPLADGAYRSSPHLAKEFVAEVDELVAGFEGGGFDPFLMAQDVPSEVKVGEAVIVDQSAIVPVTTSFEGHAFSVSLARVEGRWLITGVNLEK